MPLPQPTWSTGSRVVFQRYPRLGWDIWALITPCHSVIGCPEKALWPWVKWLVSVDTNPEYIDSCMPSLSSEVISHPAGDLGSTSQCLLHTLRSLEELWLLLWFQRNYWMLWSRKVYDITTCKDHSKYCFESTYQGQRVMSLWQPSKQEKMEVSNRECALEVVKMVSFRCVWKLEPLELPTILNMSLRREESRLTLQCFIRAPRHNVTGINLEMIKLIQGARVNTQRKKQELSPEVV